MYDISNNAQNTKLPIKFKILMF